MAYYDELYHCDNIIGYTGQLNDFPTVYFPYSNRGVFRCVWGNDYRA